MHSNNGRFSTGFREAAFLLLAVIGDVIISIGRKLLVVRGTTTVLRLDLERPES